MEEMMNRLLTMTYPFENPRLPYRFNALKPFIDTETMWLHHSAHLQDYVDNLNRILKDYPELQNKTLTELITDGENLPWQIRDDLLYNAGGVYNHIMYFMQMSPEEETGPATGNLEALILERFGGLPQLTEELAKAGLSVKGSGYAWLVLDRNGRLQVVTTGNQENPLSAGLFPVMNLDVWEHAYYLMHHNRRADYIADRNHVVDWEKVSKWLDANS